MWNKNWLVISSKTIFSENRTILVLWQNQGNRFSVNIVTLYTANTGSYLLSDLRLVTIGYFLSLVIRRLPFCAAEYDFRRLPAQVWATFVLKICYRDHPGRTVSNETGSPGRRVTGSVPYRVTGSPGHLSDPVPTLVNTPCPENPIGGPRFCR